MKHTKKRAVVVLCATIVLLTVCPAAGAESAAAVYARARDAVVRGEFVEAAALYRVAAERGHADAQYALGSLYRLGRGVELDRGEALRWLRRAAENDHHEAQYALSIMLESGDAGGDGTEASRRWLTAAALGGHEQARRRLAAVRPDPAETHVAVRSVRVPETVQQTVALAPSGPHGTPQLVEAAARGNGEAVADLLARGADLEQTDGDGRSALARAALAGHGEVVHQLLEAGAQASSASASGETPLHLAAAFDHASIVSDLIAYGADPGALQTDGSSPLVRAACAGHARTVRLLLAHEVEGGRVGTEAALRCAVARGHADSVWALLAADHRDPGWTLFLTELIGIAAENGRTIVTRILIDKLPYARTDASLTPAVALAARNGHFDVVDALVAAGADVDPTTAEGNTPLMLCAAAGEDGSVRRLLRGGADVDAVNQEGNTALMLAASVGHDRVVSLLLEAGADSLRRNRLGLRADALAAQGGHLKAAKLIRTSNSLKGWLLERF